MKIEDKADELFSGINIRPEDLNRDHQIEISSEMEEVMEEVEKADRSYKLALDDPDIYLKFSIACLSNDDLNRAEGWVKKSLRTEKNFLGLLTRGKISQLKGDHKGAIGYYDDALKYNQNFLVYKYKAQALKAREMPERALDAVDKALERKEDAELVAEKADLLVELGNVEKAKKFYEKAESLDSSIDRREKKVDDLLQEAEKKMLPKKYEEILELDKNRNEAWLGMARCYWNLDKEKKAKDCLKEALKHMEEQEILDRLEKYRDLSKESPVCPECEGNGECAKCEGSGECTRCSGSGECPDCGGTVNCSDCDGTGECQNCDGTGKSGWFSKCEVCEGSGECQTCDGYGICTTCDGTGDCPQCGGNGNCEECQGSGICEVCEGKGIKID
ncbi:MAG: tetratricopeptide repeat protein [Candidatus Thermoplasmatota archaeon]|nr:tetratricopeptide repeat protein [Candidatus Thermoplasmatota archaeon]